MESNNWAKGIWSAVVALGLGATAVSDVVLAETKQPMEKCYGIAAKGKNDCGAYDHTCAGQSKRDNDPAEWKYVPKGSCVKMGGKLTSSEKK